jgi:hypothetical protein
MRIKRPPMNELNRLLQVANGVATAFGQTPLYIQPESGLGFLATPSGGSNNQEKKHQQAKHNSNLPLQSKSNFDVSSNFHISIGWALNAPSEDSCIRRNIEAASRISEFQITVKALKLKIGNSVSSISLLSKTETTTGLFEACV